MKIDLKSAYQQLVLNEASRELVTINTPKGFFRYTRLLFGIASSPAIWQRFIDQVTACLEMIYTIMDDVLVSGRTNEEHYRNLDALFQRFQKYGLRVKPRQCFYCQESVVYMGRQLSKEGMRPTGEHLKAIVDAPAPQDVGALRSWLGMVNFQAPFVPNLSMLAHPLNTLLSTKNPFDWSPECEKAFQAIKKAVTSAPYLVHFNPDRSIILAVDASLYGVGALVSHVLPDGSNRPSAYASQTLYSHQQNYSQLDKEALAIIFGLERFRLHLYDRQFTIQSDHKPLQHILGPRRAVRALASQRLQRWAIILSALRYELQYIPGERNTIADALSRLPLPATSHRYVDAIYNICSLKLESMPVLAQDVKDATRRDAVLSKVVTFVKSSWPEEMDDERIHPFWNKRCELTEEEDCLFWALRVVIPPPLRDAVLNELHVAHPGMVQEWYGRKSQEVMCGGKLSTETSKLWFVSVQVASRHGQYRQPHR